MPFAFAVPAGTPYKDISTDPQWRVATGPYLISTYVPHQQIVLVRNPNFKQWSPNVANGHLNQVNDHTSASRPSRPSTRPSTASSTGTWRPCRPTG